MVLYIYYIIHVLSYLRISHMLVLQPLRRLAIRIHRRRALVGGCGGGKRAQRGVVPIAVAESAADAAAGDAVCAEGRVERCTASG